MRKMKDSGVEWLGEVPAEWRVTPVKHLFFISKVIAGKTGYDVLSITQRGLKVKDIKSGEGQLAADYSHYQIVEPGDFAMNHMDLLTGWIDLSDMTGVTSPDYRVFKSRIGEMNKRYYLRVFQHCYSARVFYGLCKGVSSKGRYRLPADAFNALRIPVPPLDEQLRIADYLDEKCAEIDRAVSAAEQSIEEYKTYKKSVVFQAVTKGLDADIPMKDSGVEWLGKMPAGWELHRAKHLFKLTNDRGNDDLTLLAATQKYGMWPQDRLEGVVRVKDDTDLSKFRTVHKNDYVISLRSFQGGFERSDFEGVCSPAYQTFCAIRPIDYQYFKYLFKSPSFIDHMNSLTLGIREGNTIKFDDFATQALGVPPLDEQHRIADFLDEKCFEIDLAIDAKQAIVADLKTFKQSLIYEVVTGKREV